MMTNYETPSALVVELAAEGCLCESKKGNGLDKLDGEEW